MSLVRVAGTLLLHKLRA